MVNPRRSAARMAEEGIKDYIRTHNLRPGDLLPSEAELCEAVSCSRSSLREAVRTLSSLDVVDVRHGHGTFVSTMSLEPLLQGVLLRITLNPDKSLEDLRHVIDLREAMDLGEAERLVEKLRGADLAAERELLALLTEAFGEHNPAPAEYEAFHRLLHAHLTNPLTREIADTFLRIHLECYERLQLDPPRDPVATLRAHGDMLDALEAGDLEAYRSAVSAHYVPLRRLPDQRRRGSQAGPEGHPS